MFDQSSPQQHIEADLLAAFAENSLTQHERESVLSHLAVCARCRQLLFLAHQVEPAPDTQTSSLKPRPFWRRNWFPLVASASAVVVLALVTFSWYGQFHKQAIPKELAQQRTAPMPSSNQNASSAAEVAPPPPPAAATQQESFSAKRLRPRSKAEQPLASPSLSEPLDSVTASKEEARRLTQEDRQAAVRRDQNEPSLNAAARNPQSAGAMQSAPTSSAVTEDKKGYSSRAIQPAKVGRQAVDAFDRPTSSAAVGVSPAYHMEGAAPAPGAKPAPQSEQIHAEGCVERGVEAGCLMVKDRQSGKLYHVLIKGLRPQPGDGIELTGVPHDGPTSCMQGIPLDVITWVETKTLKCAQNKAP